MCKPGRGGWVGTRNFELDSGAYFLNLLFDYYKTPGLHAPHRLLEDTKIYEAAKLMVQVGPLHWW
jgi:meiotically up-regulated gene 157 (Mug157) protein